MSDPLRDLAENAVSACLPFLPLEGSSGAGYRLSQHVHSEVRAMGACPVLNDRQVHATLADGSEVVRYNRAGKWYLESKGRRYRKLSLGTAAELARSPGATVRLGMPGGGRFDAAMRA